MIEKFEPTVFLSEGIYTKAQLEAVVKMFELQEQEIKELLSKNET